MSQKNRFVLAIVPAAGAIAVVLISLRMHFQPPTVPSFAVADAQTDVVLAPGSNFEIVVRPQGPLTGVIAARGFLLHDDEVRGWNPPFVVSIDGTVRIAGPTDALFAGVPKGSWDVAIAVGRPETLPSAPSDILRARESTANTTWRLVREHVRLD